MKDLKHYEDIHKKDIEKQILENLKKGDVSLSGGAVVKTAEDLNKKSVQFAIREDWRREGLKSFTLSQTYEVRFLLPIAGQKINNIELDVEMVLPAYAPANYEDNEVSHNMIASGLYIVLKKKFSKYYYNLLTSFDLSLCHLLT